MRPTLAAAAMLCATDAFAARPFVTDDARVVRPGGCQVEAFFKQLRPGRGSEFWFLPACNPLQRAELTLGGRRIAADEEPTTRAVILQAKTLLRALEPNGAGFAFTVGALRDRPGPGWERYVNAIAS